MVSSIQACTSSEKNNKAISNDNKTKEDNLCSAFEFVLVLV